ncbi:hypothetical protein ACHAXS_005034 [Conticribra weissflogii]
MLILSEADVRRCFPVSAAIAANRKALASLRKNGDGGARVPTRIGLPYHASGGSTGSSSSAADWTLFKPAGYYPPRENTMQNVESSESQEGEVLMGMKLVSIRSNNPKLNKPMVPATVMLVNAETGIVSAIVAATYLTAARTAAGSAIATEAAVANHPSGKDKFTLVVFGAGLQAEMHIKAIKHVVNVDKIVIVNRTLERAENLKNELLEHSSDDIDASAKTLSTVTDITALSLSDDDGVRKALKDADIIATTTNTCHPLFPGEWPKQGCHINGVGSYTPLMSEVDDKLVKRCEVIIDTKEALDVGDLTCMKGDDAPQNFVGLIGDIISGDLVVGKRRDNPNDSEIDCTFYKSVGTAIQDVFSAQAAYENAIQNRVGLSVDM